MNHPSKCIAQHECNHLVKIMLHFADYTHYIPAKCIIARQNRVHDDVIKWKHLPLTGPLWWESTGDRWISLAKASDAELWNFLWSVPEQTVEQSRRRWFETPSRSLRHHCNVNTIFFSYLTLVTRNWLDGTCNYICVFCHSNLAHWRQILHSQYHGCWWPGDARIQGISSYNTGLIFP